MSSSYKLNIEGDNKTSSERATELALMGLNDAVDSYPNLKHKDFQIIKEYIPLKAWIWEYYGDNPLTIIEFALNRITIPDWMPLLPDLVGKDRLKSLAKDLREQSLWEFNKLNPNSSHEKLAKIVDFLPKKSKTWLKKGFSIEYGLYLIKESIKLYKKHGT